VSDRGTETDLVTGAFSYSGSRIAELLIESGREVRTLTNHPDRQHPLRGKVQAAPYRFDDPFALARSLEEVTTLYNTYWVRFERGRTTFADAVANSRALFEAAQRARVARVVHLSIANPSLDSPLPYYRGKALAEQALTTADVPYAIVRPTWLFGGGQDVLANNIAWILRRFPVFVVPGDGRYLVQPIHVDDLAHMCLRAAQGPADVIMDAAGPDTMSFEQLVIAIRHAVGRRTPILHAPPAGMAALARALGLVVRDVVLTADEIRGLTAGLLVSHHPPLGQTSLIEWLNENGSTLGGAYANELNRHFRMRQTSHLSAMSDHADALAWAEAQLAAVREDPEARLALLARTYHGPTGRAPRHLPFRRAALSFMRWQAHRGLLDPLDASPPGSLWWRAVNERLLRDGCESIALAGGLAGEPSSHAVRLWLKFIARPTARNWYRAHNASIVSGYLEHRRLAETESPPERFFMNVALVRVLYAHALVAAPRLAVGRFAPLGRLLGDPRLGMAGAFLSLRRVVPNRYPLARDVETYIADEQRLGRLLDYAVIAPRTQRMYEWSAEELGEPRLLELVRDGNPIYAWPFEQRHVWRSPGMPLAGRVLARATRARC
jgi:nucleoside-diphosphate-sugar epimerase